MGKDFGKIKKQKTNYSRLSLNGHVELVPSFLYSFYLTLYKTNTSLGRTLSAGPKGVRLRETGAPNENVVQNHVNAAFLNVF